MVHILKIGGSVLTDKALPSFLRQDQVDRIAREVAKSSSRLVLIHGAGSFGHLPAKTFGLPDRFNPEGLFHTHNSVVRLNQMVLEALFKAGSLPLPVHPLDCLLLKNGRIERMETAPLEEMVSRGLLPVLHGDVAMDVSKGAGIVSGDQLVSYLAKELDADMVALGTDVDGVMKGGELYSRLTRSDLSDLEAHFGSLRGTDITGGMRGKLMELLELAEAGIESQIFNAAKDGNVERALRGEHIGTMVGR